MKKLILAVVLVTVISLFAVQYSDAAGTHYCSEVDTSNCGEIKGKTISADKINIAGTASPSLYVDNTNGLYAASFADDILTDNIILSNTLGKTIKVQDATLATSGSPLYILGGKGSFEAAPVNGGNVYIYGGEEGGGGINGNVILAYTGSAARGAVGIGTNSISSGYSLEVNGNASFNGIVNASAVGIGTSAISAGYLLDVNGKAKASDFCTSSKCLSTMSASLTYPLSLPALGGFDFTLANDGWTGINLANSPLNYKRIIIGVDAGKSHNVFDIEDVTGWNHKMELRADGSAVFNNVLLSDLANVGGASSISGVKLDVRGPIATSSFQDGGALRIYDLTDTTRWFEMNFDKVNNWGTFQRTIVPTVDGGNGIGASNRRWGSAYTSGLDVKGDVVIDLS